MKNGNGTTFSTVSAHSCNEFSSETDGIRSKNPCTDDAGLKFHSETFLGEFNK